MNLSRLGRAEYLAVLGGLLLALGLFLPWYGTNADNRNANIDGARGTLSGWEVHPILRWLLLAAALAPLILAWIIAARPRAVVAARGDDRGRGDDRARARPLRRLHRPARASRRARSRSVRLVRRAARRVLMLVGGAPRASGTERPRKPPGVL